MIFFKNLFIKKNRTIEILAPVDGELISIDKVPDEVFAQKILGDGFAIKPTNNNFVAPISGKLVTVYPTGHAYGIQHSSGIELLLHIGIDTVNLNGKGFDIKVNVGQTVKAGAEVCIVDLKAIKGSVPSIDTPVVFTQSSMKDFELEITKYGLVTAGEVVAIIKSK